MNLKVLLSTLVAIILISVSSFTGYYFLVSDSQSKVFNVTKVFDGDTVEIETGEKVRLLGINAPEKNEFYYQEAKERLAELAEGKSVKLIAGSMNKDRYGRLLRYIFINNSFVNLQLVKEGYATVYGINSNENYYLELKKAEEEAKEKSLGIWSISNISNCIKIVAFNYDARGNDNENLNDEYVTFQNKCKESINMTNWIIKDTANNVYIFKNFVFGGNSNVTLYTGYGSDKSTELFWNKRQAVWNNNGDTLFLRDDKGNLVLSYSYP